ncbi:hypothetical protein UPYG_G00244140 [Umbra pygmaea]|uniref:Tetratricopeptide repeat protein 29 n=1 Tax=Umbra pygmaea TaxID=75934 RepID=A0ABD0WL15_UMBPY
MSGSSSVARRQEVNFLPDINKPQKHSLAHGWTNPRSRLPKGNELPQQGRSQRPTISKDEIAMFRNSVWKNTCVEMLRGGFHRSFSELSAVLGRWKESRLAAGPGSVIWQQESLDKQPNKLHTLQHYLTRAEAAQRAGAWDQVYDNQLCLAQFFSEPEDRWLSHHFYQVSLASAQRFKMDGGQKEAEASANVAQVYMEQGQVDQARELYECLHQLTAGRLWSKVGGISLRSEACEGLCKVYTLLADGLLQTNDYKPAIKMLNKAFQMAKEAGDRRIEGEAAYRVGVAYQCVGDQEMAKRFLNMYMEICLALKDAEGQGKAYKAITKSLESEGKQAESVQCLEKYAEVSQSNGQQRNLQDACMCLGVACTSRGHDNRACTYFEQGYEIARDLGEVSLLQKAQVYLGSARAYSMIRKYSRHVETASHSDLQILIAWKARREDVFTDTTSSVTHT